MFVTVIALRYALLVGQWSCGHFLKLADSILFQLTRHFTRRVMSCHTHKMAIVSWPWTLWRHCRPMYMNLLAYFLSVLCSVGGDGACRGFQRLASGPLLASVSTRPWLMWQATLASLSIRLVRRWRRRDLRAGPPLPVKNERAVNTNENNKRICIRVVHGLGWVGLGLL